MMNSFFNRLIRLVRGDPQPLVKIEPNLLVLHQVKITDKWRRMAEIYKRFCDQTEFYDFSEDAAVRMFLHESRGEKISEKMPNGKWNGYLVGKKWMNLTITEYWIPDLDEHKTLFAIELYQDFPHWFLIKVLPRRYHISKADADEVYAH